VDRCDARCCELLVKRRELFRTTRDFIAEFSRMQKTLVKCGFLAFGVRAARCRRDALAGARKRSRRRSNVVDSTKIDPQKFFWITSRNRAVDDPIAIGIARIGRLAIRMCIASRDREGEARVPNRGDACAERRFDG